MKARVSHLPSLQNPAQTNQPSHSVFKFNQNQSRIMNHPSSPTDLVMSPITRKLKINRKHHMFGDNQDPEVIKEEIRNSMCYPQYSLQNAIDNSSWSLNPTGSTKLILASSSASRKAVIDELNWPYEQMSPDIDEKAIRCDDPHELPILIAKAKAQAIIDRLEIANETEPCIIITMDQITLYDGKVREKPINESEAFEFLSSYSNNYVSTLSAVIITAFPSKKQKAGLDTATVHWHNISDEIVKKVITKGQIFSSAGGFRIEDEDLNPLIKNIEGTVDSVMGFPIDLTENLINEVLIQLHNEIYPIKRIKSEERNNYKYDEQVTLSTSYSMEQDDK
eukprot:gene11076-14871_t